LKTLFLISATTHMHSDAVNMQEVTTIPALFWALFWIALSILALATAVRAYVSRLGLIPKPSK
jgi:hypothetical protein